MLRTLLLALWLSFLLAGCGSMPTRDRPSASATLAEQQFAQGEFQAAAQSFTQAATEQRSARDYYRLRAAEAWREEGDLAQARMALEGVNARYFSADEQLRMSLLQAELALDADDAGSALAILTLPSDSVPDAYRERFHYLRARGFEKTGDAFSAATERTALDPWLAPVDQAENQRRVQQLLKRVDDDTLYQRSAQLPVGHPLYVHAGRLLSSRGLSLPRPYDRTTTIGAGDANRPPMDATGYRPFRQIALLLPVEGSFAAAGSAVRDGFFSAYYAESRVRPAVKLYDSGGDADAAVAAYHQAVAEGADLVIGPLARDSVAALFERGAISTPLLALNRGGEAPPPPGSVSFALAPEDEGIAAAERMLRRGWKRVIAAAGDDESAQRTLAAFREHFTARDGVVVAEVRLPESAPDYAPLIRQALNAAGTRSTSETSDGSEIAAPSTAADADAIFLAARSAQARLFAPQLRVAGVYDLPIVATSMIAAGGSNARLDRELDGIEFTELPWLISDRPGLPERQPLAENLDTARGAGARLFAFGMDAFQLAGRLDQLAADPNARIPGATGELRLDGFGQVQRAPAWARYSNGYVQPAPDGGLTSDGVEYRQP